uniref:tetratricopeptide repeat protein n=1 Tax=uncultured Nostoc sp. TaxID=340711 RepID=UPI0035CC4CEC
MLKVEVQQNVEADQLKRSLCQVIVASAKQIPEIVVLEVAAQWQQWIPHLEETALYFNEVISDEGLVWVFKGVSNFYEGQGLYAAAQSWLQIGLAVIEDRLGSNHCDTATSLNNLAIVYQMTGRYIDAEPLFMRALQIY